jgi:Mg-chelatase subunit ChlI
VPGFPRIGAARAQWPKAGARVRRRRRTTACDPAGAASADAAGTRRRARQRTHSGRDAFERDPRRFVAAWAREEAATRRRILAARRLLPKVRVTDAILADTAKLCLALGTDGLRGELTLMRTARALAALEGDAEVTVAHLRRIAAPALRHRLRRDPLDEAVAGTRVERALAEVLPP